MTDRDALAQEIEAEINCWRGANGGVFTIHACALSVASITLRHIAAARAEALEEAAKICQGRANGYSIYDTQMEAAQEAIVCRNLIRALMEPPA